MYEDEKDLAEVMNKRFRSVFTDEGEIDGDNVEERQVMFNYINVSME